MDLIVRHRDRTEKVGVRRTREGYEVRVGESSYQVDAAPSRDGILSLRVGGNQYEVAVLLEGPSGEGRYWVSSAEGSAPVSVVDPLTHLAQESRGGEGVRKSERVTAYMPGRVIAVLVEEGAEVEAGQGVVVLEAMKMENEIQVEHDGVIERLLVEPGQTVDGGDPLFELG